MISSSRDIWQDTFDEVVEKTDDPLRASVCADDTVADWYARQADEAYDHWRDLQME